MLPIMIASLKGRNLLVIDLLSVLTMLEFTSPHAEFTFETENKALKVMKFH